MMGVGLTMVPTIGTGTALTVATEPGPDFSAFPWSGVFALGGVAADARVRVRVGGALPQQLVGVGPLRPRPAPAVVLVVGVWLAARIHPF